VEKKPIKLKRKKTNREGNESDHVYPPALKNLDSCFSICVSIDKEYDWISNK
jgi:hypothetical protein